jgi:DNA-binding MurR/RpiR family transcriptional regulator
MHRIIIPSHCGFCVLSCNSQKSQFMPQDDAPATVKDFRKRLIAVSDTLPKRLRQCADYLAMNTDKIAVSTVAELSQQAGVQPSAFMRFCQLLGFSGFSELQKLFRQDYNQRWPNYSTRLDALRTQKAGNPYALLAEFVETGRASLESLTATVDEAALQKAVDILVAAPTLHLIGLKRAFPIAYYLAYAFGKMSVPALLHDRIGELDQQHMLRPGDALIAISYAPYTQNTLDAATLAAAHGLQVVAITDALNSPLQRAGHATLLVREVDMGDFRALSASFALAITLATAVGARRG